MDVIVGQVLSRWYTYLYEKIGIQLNAPPPNQVFSCANQIMNSIYDISPPIFKTYYTILNSIPVQTDIIPIALIMLVLYALFAIIVFVIRGLFKVVYGFIRLTIVLCILFTLIASLLQYTSILDAKSLFLRSKTGTLSRSSPSTL